MLKRQPGRPSEEEFIGAALRFVNDGYEPYTYYNTMTHSVHTIPNMGKVHDVEVIIREREAEGREGDAVTLEAFAIRQLAAYRRLRKPS